MPTGTSTQIVQVVAPQAAATHAALTLWAKTGPCWKKAGGPWPARVGRNGLSFHHREGDGTTPLGTFGFGSTVYGLARNPGLRFKFHRLVCGDWWDEDSSSPAYNTFQHIPCNARPPFGAGSEALWRQTVAYMYFAVIAYNADPVVPTRGSAMFLHVDTGSATNGCVSLPRARLVRLLRWLAPAARPRISISLGH